MVPPTRQQWQRVRKTAWGIEVNTAIDVRRHGNNIDPSARRNAARAAHHSAGSTNRFDYGAVISLSHEAQTR